MPRLALRFAFRFAALAVGHLRTRALLTGLMLGSLTHALATQPRDPAFACAMALVMVVSGTIAFVLHALAVQPARTPAERLRRVRDGVLAIGGGVLVAAHGLATLTAVPSIA